ncbi:MAG: hypothetical protein AAB693_02215 [Patescibacteria group bacterium]
MSKSIQLKFVKVKYKGDSIGDDIRVEIEALGKFLRFDKKIKSGTTIEIDQEICRVETNQKALSAEVFITILEKDLLFNDIGSTKSSIKIDSNSTEPQKFTFEIKMKETRSIIGKVWGKKIAIFELTLEAVVSEVIRYVFDEGDGWLKIVLENNKSIGWLPAYLKIKVEEHTNAKREYFTILEGPYRSKLASVKFKPDGSSRFVSEIKHEPMAIAIYSISKKTLILKGKEYKTTDYEKVRWQKGLYDIEIPDYPHPGGRNYLNRSRQAMTWFRIGHGGDAYLHVGSFSLGCITVTETERWTEIYQTLIKARKGDFISVGVLEVVD